MSYNEELAGFRKVMDEWMPTGTMTRDQELAELKRLIGRHPAEARQILGHYDEAMADREVPT
jgi:predicted urease superfamily metal-dependent hydrolase